jgi:TRAP-type C4-dicarboxylate transport system permease small subunit
MRQGMMTVAVTLGHVARAALWLAGICLILMTLFIAVQVFSRYVLGASQTWTEPTAILLMGWFIFLGAAVGIREGYHLSFDVLLYVLPEGAGKVLHSLSDIAVGAFGAGMLWYGAELMIRTWTAVMPTLGLPGGVAFLPITLGGALVLIFSLERLARRAAGLHTMRFGEDAPVE